MIMKHAIHSLLLLSLFLIQSTLAQTINVTDKQGRGITATLLSSDGKTVKISRDSDSKNFSLPIEGLNGATQGAIKRWMDAGGNLAETYEVLVDTGKTRRTTGQEDFDDKRVNLVPTVTVKNTDTANATKAHHLTILFLGRPVDSTTDIYVFRKQTFELPRIRPLSSRTFEVAAISQAYDNRGYAQFGARYLGYVWFVHNKAGTRVVKCASVPSSLAAKHAEKLLNLEENGIYNRDLRSLE